MSAICALIALRNHINKSEHQTEIAENTAQYWSRDIEQIARKHSKLIFINTDLSSFKPSNTTKKILEQNYISVEILPDTFPADYFILNSILAKKSRTHQALKAGILSPNLYPIYLTSQYKSRVSYNAPTLDEAIYIAAKQHEENPYILKSTARSATNFDSLPQGFFNGLHFANSFVKLSFIHSESANLFMYFHSQKPLLDSPAILSENARLASKISILNFNDISARNALVNATKILCKRIISKEQLSAKLLYLRALGESPFTQSDKNLYSFYLQNVNKILPEEKKLDITFFKHDKMSIKDVALLVSVLSQAYAISGNSHFLKAAENSALFLSSKIESSDVLPAKIGVHSEASSLEYVLCARAFFDISKVSSNKNWNEYAHKTISKWNENFMTDIKLWSINSKKSAFAKFTRPIITQDTELPSYLGEASQLFSEMGINNTPTAKILQKISANAMSDSLLSKRNWASLKLATLPQYAPPTL